MFSIPFIKDKNTLLELADMVGIVEFRYVNNDLLIADFNKGAENIYGYSAEEVLGKSFSMFHLPDDVDFVFPLIIAKMAKTKRGHADELIIITKDRREVPVFTTSYPIFHDDELTGVLIFSFDLSRQAKDRENLLQINRQLENLVDEETKRRIDTEKIVFEQKKFADMGQMLAAIAHQWRQPLNALALHVQEVKDVFDFGELDKDFVNEFEKSSIDLIKHMSDTIEDFRNFFMSGKSELFFDLAETLIATLRLFKAQFISKNIKFIIQCDCHEGCSVSLENIQVPPCSIKGTIIKGSSGEFKQVVMNLITNSIDAIDTAREGDANIQGFIKIFIKKTKSSVSISFEDNGTGLSQEVMDNIYDPTFTTKESGTGIGLYMTKLIIEDTFDGKLKAGNTKNGAIFTICLSLSGKGG